MTSDSLSDKVYEWDDDKQFVFTRQILSLKKTKYVVVGYIASHFSKSAVYTYFPESLSMLTMQFLGSIFISLDINPNPMSICNLMSSLLFKPLSNALQESCLDTQRTEGVIVEEMEFMQNEMKNLHNELDKHLEEQNDDPQIATVISNQFHKIQHKLSEIETKQNLIHEKIKILNKVEKLMIKLQNDYDTQIDGLQRQKNYVLTDLAEQKKRKEKEIKIYHLQRSFSVWSSAKLKHVIYIAENNKNDKDDKRFGAEINQFLTELDNHTKHRKLIISEYDGCIENLKSELLRIQDEISQVQRMTNDKIHDLQKLIEIANTIATGHRKLSESNDESEIERESGYKCVAIERKLNILKTTMDGIMYSHHDEGRLDEMMDLQWIMSDKNLKLFFSVFIQTFMLTVVDIESYHNRMKRRDGNNDKVENICDQFYGIHNVLNKICRKRSMMEKTRHCMRFIKILKKSLMYDAKKRQKELCDNFGNYLDTDLLIRPYDLTQIAINIGRKLCVDEKIKNEIIFNRNGLQAAQKKLRHLFVAVLNTKHLRNIFYVKPLSAKQAAQCVLEKVYHIDTKQAIYI